LDFARSGVNLCLLLAVHSGQDRPSRLLLVADPALQQLPAMGRYRVAHTWRAWPALMQQGCNGLHRYPPACKAVSSAKTQAGNEIWQRRHMLLAARIEAQLDALDGAQLQTGNGLRTIAGAQHSAMGPKHIPPPRSGSRLQPCTCCSSPGWSGCLLWQARPQSSGELRRATARSVRWLRYGGG